MLISAHDMNPLLPVMDRIVYLAGGRAATGTTEEVVRTDVLSDLYGQHVDVIRVHDRILVVAGGAAAPGRRRRPRTRPPARAKTSRSQTRTWRRASDRDPPAAPDLRARLLRQPAGAVGAAGRRHRRRGVRHRRVVRGAPRPVLRWRRPGRHQRGRRLGVVPGRGQPAVGFRRRGGRAGRRGDGHDRGAAADVAATWPPASSAAPGWAWARCSCTSTPRTPAPPGRRSPSCSARCSPFPARSSR